MKKDAYEEWLATRPAKIAEVARKYPPNTCYRGKGDDDHSHYIIFAYEEPHEGPITLKIIHGADSFLPGHLIFGVPIENIEVCGCGKWSAATDEQAEQAHELALAIAAKSPSIQARRRKNMSKC